MTPRPFRFGVQASDTASAGEWIELARRCEDCGYSTLTMPDHFDRQFAPVPALMAAAAATRTLRVGALVFDNDYRHPAVLAKELATMDVLSAGRVDIGLGAGWLATDYAKLGLVYDPPGVRVDRFVEGLEIVRRCMVGETFSFAGEHYTMTDYDPFPAAVQRPCPPILIGGGGKRVLTLAAEHADIVGVNTTLHGGLVDAQALATMTAEAVDAKVDIVRNAAGEHFEAIELNVRAFMVNVTADGRGEMANIAAMIGFSEQQVRDTPYALIGSPPEIADKLRAMRERWGFSYVIVGGADVEGIAPVVAELAGT